MAKPSRIETLFKSSSIGQNDPPSPANCLINDAWIGDAVLGLYARLKILRETGRADGEIFTRLTSNQFLGCFGEPTKVEAALGRIYAEQGIEAAFTWIELNLVPLFERQQHNRSLKNLSR